MQEQKFTANTCAEAHRMADDWLAKNLNVRPIARREVAAGWGGPPPVEVTECVVTIHYETDASIDNGRVMGE